MQHILVSTTVRVRQRQASHPLLALAIVLVVGLTFQAISAELSPRAKLQLLAEGFTSPLNLVELPDGSGRLLVGDQIGTIHVLNKDGGLAPELFLNLTNRLVPLAQGFDERGLLGIALHPKFRENRRLILYYSAPLRPTAPTNFNHTSRISEFKVMAGDFAKADPRSERVLMEFDEPQMNHNGGRILFGPDGHLYVGVGDGGNANDEGVGHGPNGNGQDPGVLLGKILRINVDEGSTYTVPKDNPFVGQAGFRPEIYALGFRNPWGLAFDRGGQQELFVADVGQNLYEELNIVTKGGNYGWRVREGFHPFDPKSANKPPADAPTADAHGKPFVDPILEYQHPPRGRIDPEALVGISITGGYIYRGKAFPQWAGKYIFGDWSRSWALPDGVFFVATRPASGKGGWSLERLNVEVPGGKLGGYITAFGEDLNGELYILTNARNTVTGKTGKVFKLVPQ